MDLHLRMCITSMSKSPGMASNARHNGINELLSMDDYARIGIKARNAPSARRGEVIIWHERNQINSMRVRELFATSRTTLRKNKASRARGRLLLRAGRRTC